MKIVIAVDTEKKALKERAKDPKKMSSDEIEAAVRYLLSRA